MTKSTIWAVVSLLVVTNLVRANGVLVVDASKPTVATLVSSQVSVSIDEQVAVTRATQVFRNTTGSAIHGSFAFPLPDGASATQLRWNMEGIWHATMFTEVPQDTSLPGGTAAAVLTQYLGATPLLFPVDSTLKADSTVTVELTYVQLLGYKNGIVTYTYPNDYHLISTTPIGLQQLDVTIASQRTIESVQCPSHTGATVTNSGNTASITHSLQEMAAGVNYVVNYQLSSTQLGLFGMSTSLPDSLGYFTFVVEPDPSEKPIQKNFVVIVDRSGSMGGIKMQQAIDAAKYIVTNLNEGDRFNLIDFDDMITTFRTGLVPFTAAARDSAVAYASSLGARGLTDICGAFARAIPQFASVPDTNANIILFLTDGVPTQGETRTDSILAIVGRQVQQTGKRIFVYNFGIGPDVNTQLLTLLGTQNGGFATFLGNDEVQSRVTDFYTTVRNPLLIDPHAQFASDSIYEVYPDPLPNLYKGQQILVSGRYRTPGNVGVTFTGTAFGRPVTYNFTMALSDSQVPAYDFLPKVWAKLKIEHLLVEYYSAPQGSDQATLLKNTIIQISVRYGVQSPFTSFATTTSVQEHTAGTASAHPETYELLGNYPNPFNPGTNIRVRVNSIQPHAIVVKIFNIQGQLIRTLLLQTSGEGEYQVYWDGRNEAGLTMPTGTYIYTVDFGRTILAGKMVLVK